MRHSYIHQDQNVFIPQILTESSIALINHRRKHSATKRDVPRLVIMCALKCSKLVTEHVAVLLVVGFPQD